ncbi:hypothetical protein U1Q18_051542 [Sarracenia purpurea var. burkii]
MAKAKECDKWEPWNVRIHGKGDWLDMCEMRKNLEITGCAIVEKKDRKKLKRKIEDEDHNSEDGKEVKNGPGIKNKVKGNSSKRKSDSIDFMKEVLDVKKRDNVEKEITDLKKKNKKLEMENVELKSIIKSRKYVIEIERKLDGFRQDISTVTAIKNDNQTASPPHLAEISSKAVFEDDFSDTHDLHTSFDISKPTNDAMSPASSKMVNENEIIAEKLNDDYATKLFKGAADLSKVNTFIGEKCSNERKRWKGDDNVDVINTCIKKINWGRGITSGTTTGFFDTGTCGTTGHDHWLSDSGTTGTNDTTSGTTTGFFDTGTSGATGHDHWLSDSDTTGTNDTTSGTTTGFFDTGTSGDTGPTGIMTTGSVIVVPLVPMVPPVVLPQGFSTLVPWWH